jgi:tRNA(Arg) A34 adenosine deaminase TadA/CheY-like chemotaxis protein
MSDGDFINILIAEDNDVSREMMAGVLRAQGYRIYGAIDGESAIKVVEDRDIDLAFVDVNMTPRGGFEFVKYLVVKGINLPVILVTADDSSDLLMEATALGVKRIIQKPIQPELLVQIAQRLLKQKGLNPKPIAVATADTRLSALDLMKRAIQLADKNAKSKRGGPFGAIVSDKDGRILGEGMNGISSRVDPTAHAEVMAIRNAADKLGRADLSDCILYCSSQPTMMGKALIASVGIQKVYYGLTHQEISSVRDRAKPHYTPAEYIQLAHDDALEMFKNWEQQKDKVSD